ncbi:MAG: alpha-galactosidase [Roseburia sp.]|nr:alpha-galactosidase [Roseburia sp.]MCM1099149.1 alpha-galactosidase [Ruminococcus flavefaciens]
MITEKNGIFALETAQTSYLFGRTETGHLEHLYYGRKIRVRDADALREKHGFPPGNGISYDEVHKNVCLEDACLEFSSYGKGDIREPFLEVVYADGSFTSDFLYASCEIDETKPEFPDLPGSYREEGVAEHLCIRLKERTKAAELELHYYVYPECDVICRNARLVNTGEEPIVLRRLMSLQLDFASDDLVLTTFTGEWAREMKRTDHRLRAGKQVNASYAGVSSSRANPFVMLSGEQTTEDAGDCYGLNLIYSGNHYEAAEVNGFGKTRVVAGINPQSFSWELGPGEDFWSPEGVMTFSHQGFNGMSGHLHCFVREHIVRGEWKKKPRPVLLNSWEAAYFDIDEKKLLKLARAGKEAGIELFVMDDGWFGERTDDARSLGDWTVNEKKLPGGLSGLCGKIRQLGLDFGIWVEPEMVNVKSRLYREHPDWALEIPGREHSEGRNQRVLDLTRQEVQDFIIREMTEVFSSADIRYVKWDMNRIFSDVYSRALAPGEQGEVFHRYVCGLYRCMRTLTERFPEILFEGCSSGGNRFDLGILCYFPQIWASDNTDALCRAEIQNGYSYGYPLSTVSAHVSSCPNHQTLRNTPLETRFQVAAFGICGYECNFSDMSREELAAVKEQIALYKKWREVLQFGDFYRGRSFAGESGSGYHSALGAGVQNTMEWTCVAPDGKRAVGLLFQKLAAPNDFFACYRAKGLKEEFLYRFNNRKLNYHLKDFGGLVNMISPVHIRQDSLLESLADRLVRLEGETEDCLIYGDALMYHGVKLKQAFGSVGFGVDTRVYQDFGSRMYFMEAQEAESDELSRRKSNTTP